MKLSRWLASQDFSQVEFARIVECSPSAICLIVAGKRMPRPRLARKIVAATDNKVSLDDLMNSLTA